MRWLAILMMMIAWMFYGAMPALANCPICDSVTSMPVESSMIMHGDMAGMVDHADIAQHHQKQPENPCAGGMAHVASCAACLALPPTLAIEGGKNPFSYPAPSSGQRLADLRPQPTAPPPRFA